MGLVTVQYSLLIAGVILMLGGCGLLAVKNGKFSLTRNFASLRPGKSVIDFGLGLIEVLSA